MRLPSRKCKRSTVHFKRSTSPCSVNYTRYRITLPQFRAYLSAPALIILSRADHFTSRLVVQRNATHYVPRCVCSCNNRVNNLVERAVDGRDAREHAGSWCVSSGLRNQIFARLEPRFTRRSSRILNTQHLPRPADGKLVERSRGGGEGRG